MSDVCVLSPSTPNFEVARLSIQLSAFGCGLLKDGK